MTAHDELRVLYALRRAALARHADGGIPADASPVAQLIEERERQILDGHEGPAPTEIARKAGRDEALRLAA